MSEQLSKVNLILLLIEVMSESSNNKKRVAALQLTILALC